MKVQFNLIAFLFFLVSPLFAGERYAGEFLLGVESPRGSAMGNVGFAIPNGGYSSARNAAFLSSITSPSISLFHTDRFTGVVRNDFIGIVLPYEKRGLGIAIYRSSVEKIPFTKLTDPTLPPSELNRVIVEKYVSNQEYAIWISQGFKYNEQISLGISLKPILKFLGNESAFGLGIDAATNIQFSRDLRATIALTDLTASPIKWSTGRVESIKPRIQNGISYNFSLSKLHADLLLVVASEVRFDQGDDNLFQFQTGFEYTIEKVVSLRIGYVREDLVYGGGIFFHPIKIDYAFMNNDLGNVHYLGVTLNGEFFVK